MLYKLLSNSMQHDRKVEVISLSDRGQLGDKIEALGIRVSTIGMQSGIPHPLAIFRLTRLLRQQKPTIIQTWMYHSDLIGGWLGRHILKVPVVWNVRSNIVPFAKDKRTWLSVRVATQAPELRHLSKRFESLMYSLLRPAIVPWGIVENGSVEPGEGANILPGYGNKLRCHLRGLTFKVTGDARQGGLGRE